MVETAVPEYVDRRTPDLLMRERKGFVKDGNLGGQFYKESDVAMGDTGLDVTEIAVGPRVDCSQRMPLRRMMRC